MKIECCPNCFGTSYANGVCPQCGYRLRNDKNRSARNLPAGTVLNQRYCVGRILGAGGFGITYKAWDAKLKKICCVKEYAPADFCVRVTDGSSLELLSRSFEEPYRAGLRRFTEEARILSGLDRIPSVVRISDTFRENGTAYFAMEFLDGADLKQIVRSDACRLSFRQVTDIILTVALSMDVIHTRTGIIHRDISPENIFITGDGRVKLIDFGSAKQTESGVKDGLSVVLKPKYAPPEQYSSRMLQGAFTDVYSLAGTYYYALTKTNVPPAMDRLAGKAYTPLKQAGLGVPDGVSDAVDHALLLNVQQRTPTMQAFVSEVAAALPQPKQEKPPEPAPGENRGKPVPYVTVVSAGTQCGKRMELEPDRYYTVGRSAEAGFQIVYPDISRIHCSVCYAADAQVFLIEDQSMNGVFYRGLRLQKGTVYRIKAPARFMLANPSCVVEFGVAFGG